MSSLPGLGRRRSPSLAGWLAVLLCVLSALVPSRAAAEDPAALAPPPLVPAAAPPAAAPPKAPAPAPAPPPVAPPAPLPAGQSLLLWSAVGEPLPGALAQALPAAKVGVLPGGPLRYAAETLTRAREAAAALRCGEAVPALESAEARLLAEVGVDDARPLLGPLQSLLLLCADRLGDEARARRAAARLQMVGGELPVEVTLVLRRYQPGALFGPPLPPTRVETDPPGAAVIRNLTRVGASPQIVAGGDPAVDMLDVELPGFRKVHRPLGTGEQLSLGLRGEDRLPVLLDAAAARPFGSDEQGAVLAAIAPLLAQRPVVLLAPAQQGGAAVAGERLRARVFDPQNRRWQGPIQDIPAGTPAEQSARLAALATGKPATAPAVAAAKPAAPAQAQPQQQRGFFANFKLPFARTKWYTWVIAGGVVALVAGLMIAGRVGKDQVTVQATYP